MTTATTPILRVENLTKCYGTACILKGASLTLGKGEIKSKVELKVAGASASAIAAVEKAGGKVELPPQPEAKAA